MQKPRGKRDVLARRGDRKRPTKPHCDQPQSRRARCAIKSPARLPSVPITVSSSAFPLFPLGFFSFEHSPPLVPQAQTQRTCSRSRCFSSLSQRRSQRFPLPEKKQRQSLFVHLLHAHHSFEPGVSLPLSRRHPSRCLPFPFPLSTFQSFLSFDRERKRRGAAMGERNRRKTRGPAQSLDIRQEAREGT